MSDFLNRVITLIIIFVMLIIGPLTIYYVSNESSAKRLIINEIELFLDEVNDKGAVNYDDLDELYSNLNSHNMNIDVEVIKKKRIAYLDDFSGEVIDTYMLCDKTNAYEEMVWDNDTDSKYEEYSIKYGFKSFYKEEAIEKLKTMESKKYVYCLEKGDIIQVNVKEITYSNAKRILNIVVDVDEEKTSYTMEKMIK